MLIPHGGQKAVLQTQGAHRVGKVAFSQQGPGLIAAHKLLPDALVDHVIEPDGVEVGNGNNVQIRSSGHQVVQIAGQLL